MTSFARKRLRAEAADRAECPFTVTTDFPKEKDQKAKKRRKRSDATAAEEVEDEDIPKKQLSPFSPSGKFKTHETMDLYYKAMPTKRWGEMTRYNSFVRK